MAHPFSMQRISSVFVSDIDRTIETLPFGFARVCIMRCDIRSTSYSMTDFLPDHYVCQGSRQPI